MTIDSDYEMGQPGAVPPWDWRKGVRESSVPAEATECGAKRFCREMASCEEARYFLDEVWELADRGPYPLFHADADNVLAQIELQEGKKDVAITAAQQAYRLSWCDGPPYAYHWGLKKSKSLLDELGTAEPDGLTNFTPTDYDPMPVDNNY